MQRQPGSYVKDKDGKLAPNAADEAMRQRHNLPEPSGKKESPSPKPLPSRERIKGKEKKEEVKTDAERA